MMGGFLAACAAAFWLGILTSISPCPLATNIAAVSFIARGVENSRRVFLSGVSYTLGRALAYTALGALVVLGLLSIPGLSNFLQRYMNKLLGPLLILVGMFLVGLVQMKFTNAVGDERLWKRLVGGGVAGAGLLGVVFALSFCPISAALFFGSLVPLSVRQESSMILPMLYGLGTGLPVILVAAAVAWSSFALAAALNRLNRLQRWAQWVTGAVFVLIGIYLSVKFIFLA